MATDIWNAQIPSGTTNGRPVKVTSTTSGAANTLHTTGAGIDEVWVYATNTSGSSVLLTIMLGGTTNPDDYIQKSILPQDGETLVIPGHRLNGSVAVKAFAATANVINCVVNANRIS
jgi:hypothetical protein